MSRLSRPCVTSSSQIPGGNPLGGVIDEIDDCLLPNRLRPDSSSSFASLNRFLNALYALFSSSSVATVSSLLLWEFFSPASVFDPPLARKPGLPFPGQRLITSPRALDELDDQPAEG